MFVSSGERTAPTLWATSSSRWWWGSSVGGGPRSVVTFSVRCLCHDGSGDGCGTGGTDERRRRVGGAGRAGRGGDRRAGRPVRAFGTPGPPLRGRRPGVGAGRGTGAA